MDAIFFSAELSKTNREMFEQCHPSRHDFAGQMATPRQTTLLMLLSAKLLVITLCSAVEIAEGDGKSTRKTKLKEEQTVDIIQTVLRSA